MQDNSVGGPEHFGLRRRRRQLSPDSDPRNLPPSTNLDTDDPRRRRSNKRRRLDSEQSTSTEPPIKYGHFGQVEAGRLKLQIVSCDGGEHRDSRNPATYLGHANLLRHDKSVYCSERPNINLVLRHADDTIFCLEKLHIVGPEHGFTAPVREGIAYVAMTMNDLRKYMDPPPYAQRHDYPPPPLHRPRSRFRSSSERLSLSEALRDPELSLALDAGEDLPRDWSYEYPRAAYRNQRNSPGSLDVDTNCEHPASGDPSDDHYGYPAGDVPFTLLSDEEPGPEDNSTQDVIDFRLQRLQRMRRRIDMDSWDRDDNWSWGLGTDDHGLPRNRNHLQRIEAMMRRPLIAADSSSTTTPTTSSPISDNVDVLLPTNDPWERLGRLPMEPSREPARNDTQVIRARFNIRSDKHKVAIRFDPPVSGRFILLKMSANRSNCDVQSIIAKGYGGSRFFPALELR